MTEKIDVISYSGEINLKGYESLSTVLRSHKPLAKKSILILATPGGDAHAGFRIARALQHTYDEFYALVPRYCKSAGTLIVIGASKLYLDDMSELGPLDVQVKKGDEVIGRNSGLDIFQSVNYLQRITIDSFREYLLELTTSARLSTKVASEIATKLACGLVQPVASQIDPIKLAEMQRATEIALEYGNRLRAKSESMTQRNLVKLVSSYPSHGFVIDRKEARQLFDNVEKPSSNLVKLGRSLSKPMMESVNSTSPTVRIDTHDLESLIPPIHANANPKQDTPDAKAGARSTKTVVRKNSRAGEAVTRGSKRVTAAK